MSAPLYDLMRKAVSRPPSVNAPEAAYNPVLDRAFFDALVVVSTNVTEYYYAGTDQEVWLIDKHFPNLAPVADSFWIETKAPTHVLSSFYGVRPWDDPANGPYGRPARWAAWFINVSTNTYNFDQEYGFDHEQTLKSLGLEGFEKHWLYAVTIFTQHVEGHMVPMWTFSMIINKETGQAVKNPEFKHGYDPYTFYSAPTTNTAEKMARLKAQLGDRPAAYVANAQTHAVTELDVESAFAQEAMALLKPLLLALSFMHCKNVEREVHHPSPHQNRRRMARNLPPFNKFHTLRIDPMKRILQQAIDSYRGRKGAATGIEMALHRYRGHFKTYTEAKPLMGVAVGTYFWQSGVRGSKKRGTVSKVYEVKP